MRSVYFPRAYKTIAPRDESKDVASLWFSRPDPGRPFMAEILVLPVGSRRAPSNWGRAVAFLQFLARELIGLAVGAFVEDVFCVDRSAVCQSGFCDFERFCAIVGFATSDKKDHPTCARTVLLGAEVQLPEHEILAAPRADRTEGI